MTFPAYTCTIKCCKIPEINSHKNVPVITIFFIQKELEEKEKQLSKHGDNKKNGDEDLPALEASETDDDPWAGLTYRIDDETGTVKLTTYFFHIWL